MFYWWSWNCFDCLILTWFYLPSRAGYLLTAFSRLSYSCWPVASTTRTWSFMGRICSKSRMVSSPAGCKRSERRVPVKTSQSSLIIHNRFINVLEQGCDMKHNCTWKPDSAMTTIKLSYYYWHWQYIFLYLHINNLVNTIKEPTFTDLNCTFEHPSHYYHQRP